MSIHIVSPFIYILFVKLLVLVPSCPESKFMRYCRKIHNIILSILSFLMLVGITYGIYSVGKFNSFNDLICLTYDDNSISYISTYVFLYSKYIEWGDTLFLHLSGKPILMLQYTHHMTTGFLMYLNLEKYISPSIFVFQALNCFVHVPMYWYFAFPKGLLYKNRKMITQAQIIQHVLCLITVFFTMTKDNCDQNRYGRLCALFLYSMYLCYFSLFYVRSYFKKIN